MHIYAYSVPELSQDSADGNALAESSRNKNKDEDSSDIPFVDAVSKNVMPIPKQKKEFLEDFDGFSVR